MTIPHSLVTSPSPPQDSAVVQQQAKELEYGDLMKLPHEVLQNICEQTVEAMCLATTDLHGNNAIFSLEYVEIPAKMQKNPGRMVFSTPLAVHALHNLRRSSIRNFQHHHLGHHEIQNPISLHPESGRQQSLADQSDDPHCESMCL